MFAFLCAQVITSAQQTDSTTDLPYYQIPEYPDAYSAGTVTGRMLDGLGYRYYWATEGLTEEDLSYKPSAEGRTLLETIEHIYGLTSTTKNAAMKLPNDRAVPLPELDFAGMRRATLENIQTASRILKSSTDEDFEEYLVIFKRSERTSEFPFWNMLNGPMADALWHTGQVVLLRRAAGNPLNPKVSVFSGKTRD